MLISADLPTTTKSSPTSVSAHVPLPWKDPSSATIPTVRHDPSTSPVNHSLILTLTWLILAPPLLTVNPPTWSSNSNVRNVMLFILEKRDVESYKWAPFHLQSCELWSTNSHPHQSHQLPLQEFWHPRGTPCLKAYKLGRVFFVSAPDFNIGSFIPVHILCSVFEFL